MTAQSPNTNHRSLLRDPKYLESLAVSFVILVLAFVIQYFAGTFATERAGNAVGDLILSNIPVFNVDIMFVYGPIIFWVIIAAICISEPKRIPFLVKAIGIFTVVRSLFITLTHIGPFPDHIPIQILGFHTTNNLFLFNSGADLFFSGHTGLPYLMALVFWNHKPMRIFCLLASVFFGIVVLLGHLHYSIDVLSAFFITYTIYHIVMKIFPRDKAVFESAG